jgi:hypothetical protein
MGGDLLDVTQPLFFAVPAEPVPANPAGGEMPIFDRSSTD